jgi:RNA recognition motif-containing protein
VQAFLQQQQLALKAAASAPSNQQLACRIYVGSLNFELSEEDIKTAFSPFGPVKSVSLTKVGGVTLFNMTQPTPTHHVPSFPHRIRSHRGRKALPSSSMPTLTRRRLRSST